MKKLLSSQQQRHLNIIEILIEAKSPVPLPEIAKKLDCSIRILYDDLEILSDLSHIFELKIDGRGVKIKFLSSTSVTEVFYHFIEKSLNFKLLKLLFFEDFINRDDLCNQLYISRGTLSQIFKQINPVLKDYYQFSINTAKLQFIGNEENIRAFFLRFFYDSFPLENWEFNSIVERKDIFQYIKNIYCYLTDDFDEIEIYQLSILTLVNAIRTKNNHFIINKPQNFRYSINIFSEFFGNTEKELFETVFQLKYTKENLVQTAFPYVNDQLFLNSKLYNVSFNNTFRTSSYTFLEKEINKLADELGLVLTNSYQLIRSIHNNTLLYPFSLTHNRNLLSNNTSLISYSNCEIFFPIDIERFKEVIINYFTFLNINDKEEAIDYLVFILFSYWSNIFSQLSSKTKRKVAVISSLGHNHSKMVSEYLQSFFSSPIIEFHHLKSKTEVNSNYFLVISNFEIPLASFNSDINQLNIHDFPTKTEIKKIHDYIIDSL